MSAITLFPGSGGSIANLDNTYEWIGFNADGTKTTLPSAGSANAKGSYAALGTTSNAWSGFYLVFGPGTTASTPRFLIDISFDNGSTVTVANFYAEPNQTTAPTSVFVPLLVGSGAQISARQQSSSASATITLALIGAVTNAQSRPSFSSIETLLADTTNTRISTSNVSLVGSGSTTYTSLVDPTSRAYGAMLYSIGQSGTTPGTAQGAMAKILTGPTGGGSETEVFRGSMYLINTTSDYRNPYYLIEKSFASGIRISGQIIVATPGTDTARYGLYGLY